MMAATLKASLKGLDVVDKARRKRGWTKTDAVWIDLATTSKATLQRFWAGIAIQSRTFKEICLAVGIEDWTSISDVDAAEVSDVSVETENFSIVPPKQHVVITIDADFADIEPHSLHQAIDILRQYGGVSMQLVDIDKGSIRLLFEGTLQDIRQIESFFHSGELVEILDIHIQDIHAVAIEELARWIFKNGISALLPGVVNLSGIDLSGADLSGADLSWTYLSGSSLQRADLSGADLRWANLSGSDLRSANLGGAYQFRLDTSKANLEWADLSTANLSESNLREFTLSRVNLSGANLDRANLQGADLSGTNLRRANLQGADLSGANLDRADLRGATLDGADIREVSVTAARFGLGIGLSGRERRELKAKGAIFEDAPGDRAFTPVPVPSGRR